MVPSVDIGRDEPLGQRGRLTDKEPVPPRLGEPRVTTGQGLTDRDVAKDRDPIDRVRVIEGQPLDDVTATVVSDSMEALMSQQRHELNPVLGHRPLAGLRVVRQVGGRRGLAVAPKVRAHDPIAGAREGGSDPVPGGVRPGMAMDQQNRGAAPAVPNAEPDLADVDVVGQEIVKHAVTLALSR